MIVSKYSSGVQYGLDFRNAEKRKPISNSQWNILLHFLHSVTKNGWTSAVFQILFLSLQGKLQHSIFKMIFLAR